jgi:hypothetical protein
MAATGELLRNRIANLKKEAADRQRKAAIKERLAASVKAMGTTPTKRASAPQPRRAHVSPRVVSAPAKKEAPVATTSPRLTDKRKAEIRARLASRAASNGFASIRKAAQIRVASAWTLSKVLLPNAGTKLQEKFASTLLTMDTNILASAVRKAAKDAFNTKLAEEFSSVHKVDLNDLLENPSVLTKLKKEVLNEAKAASKKRADDQAATPDMAVGDRPADAGTGKQPDTYSEPNSDGPKLPGGGDMPAAPVSKGPGAANAPKEASKAKKAKGEDAATTTDTPAVEDPAMEEEDEVTDENVVDEVEELKARVSEAEGSIEQLTAEIAEVEGTELELGDVFGNESNEGSLANEGDGGEEEVDYFGGDGEGKEGSAEGEITDEEDFFGPTDTMDMEDMVDGGVGVEIAEPADFFEHKVRANSADRVMAKSNAERRASLLDEVVEPGDIADHFESDLAGDDRDLETDHEDDILSEVFEKMDQSKFEQDDYHTEPEFEKAAAKAAAARTVKMKDQANAGARAKAAAALGTPKAVTRPTAKAAGKKPVMTIDPAPATKSAGISEREAIARLVFGDD